MVALLGLLAFAGYQNRDKISEMLNRAAADPREPRDPAGSNRPAALGGVLSGLGDLLGGRNAAGAILTGGLGDLLERFKQTGQGEVADSWVSTGPNRGLTAAEMEQAVGADNIAELSTRTGLPREELLDRLSTKIPEGVNQLTPEGRLPTEDEAVRLLAPSNRGSPSAGSTIST